MNGKEQHGFCQGPSKHEVWTSSWSKGCRPKKCPVAPCSAPIDWKTTPAPGDKCK